MNYEVARMRLVSHSNLPGTDLPETESFVWHLWNADRTKDPPDITGLADDIITCLRVANHAMNGPIPSESRSADQQRSVIVDLAYSVSGIICAGLKYHRLWSRTRRLDSSVCELLEDATYRIAYAWDEVLAGDMDNILEGFEIASAME